LLFHVSQFKTSALHRLNRFNVDYQYALALLRAVGVSLDYFEEEFSVIAFVSYEFKLNVSLF
jgi:hypothetical protein